MNPPSALYAYNLYWGETHHNTYQFGEQVPPMDEICRCAAAHLDFYAAAYYTPQASAFQRGGHPGEVAGKQDLILEKWKSDARLAGEWDQVERATAAYNQPGRFVTFPGYEWQGDGTCGDHNVIHLTEGHPIARVMTVGQLYGGLRAIDAIAIPHHTGYQPGFRSPDWSRCDERLSPFVEVYSVHGCSETDEEWIGLRRNSHMGPGTAGGTYQDALDRGLHVGAVCSTDNWSDMPGCHGQGLMAVWAEELTRESLWRAFLARRVYGVTGDRIRLEFTVNGMPMGSVGPAADRQTINARVVASDALDRIELLRDGRVIATHCHQGTWCLPPRGRRGRFKVRLEWGWGPRPNELDLPERRWQGRLSIAEGRLTGCEPCWITPGQVMPALKGGHADLVGCSATRSADGPRQNATVFEFEAMPEADLRLELNGQVLQSSVHELARGSRMMWYRDECVTMLERHFGLEPHSHERTDPYYAMAYRAKLHRIIPEAGYTAEFVYRDDEPVDHETHYRLRVEQRNGQRAWSSPIWVSRRPA